MISRTALYLGLTLCGGAAIQTCTSITKKNNVDNRNPGSGDSKPDEDKPAIVPTGTPAAGVETEVPTVAPLVIADVGSGDHDFGVTYSYDKVLKYAVNFNTKLKDEEVNKLPAKIKYAVYQSITVDYITEWIEIDRSILKGGTITFTDQAVIKKFIGQQKSIDVIFGVPDKDNKVMPSYVLPMGTFCEQYESRYFNNETQPEKPCTDVTEADVKAKAPDAFK